MGSFCFTLLPWVGRRRLLWYPPCPKGRAAVLAATTVGAECDGICVSPDGASSRRDAARAQNDWPTPEGREGKQSEKSDSGRGRQPMATASGRVPKRESRREPDSSSGPSQRDVLRHQLSTTPSHHLDTPRILAAAGQIRSVGRDLLVVSGVGASHTVRPHSGGRGTGAQDAHPYAEPSRLGSCARLLIVLTSRSTTIRRASWVVKCGAANACLGEISWRAGRQDAERTGMSRCC
jgi:hypothetical protein